MLIRVVLWFVFTSCALLSAASLCLGQTVNRPEPISAPRPAYTPIARSKHIHGVVLIDVQVDKEGKVVDAVVLMGGQYIRDTALTSAKQWRFKPQDNPSSYSVRLTFIFS